MMAVCDQCGKEFYFNDSRYYCRDHKILCCSDECVQKVEKPPEIYCRLCADRFECKIKNA